MTVKTVLLISLVSLAGLSCGAPPPPTTTAGRPTPAPTPATRPIADASPTTIATADWPGVYAMPSDVGGFAGAVLALEEGSAGRIAYRMHVYSDAASPSGIEQDELRGSCVTDGDALYLPRASGYMLNGKPRLLARVDRYTRITVNGHRTLMRDDALRAYRSQNQLYDYGILVKVADKADGRLDLKKVERPSIKLLYADPNKPWDDPFVHGPNSR